MSLFRRAGALIARFFTSAADPAAVADEFKLYSKDDAGASQLFGRSDNGTVYQITPPAVGVGGSGTNGFVARWTPDGNTLGDSVIQDDGVAVLTGETSEEVRWSVNGDDAGVAYFAQVDIIHDDDDNIPSVHVNAVGATPLAEVQAESQAGAGPTMRATLTTTATGAAPRATGTLIAEGAETGFGGAAILRAFSSGAGDAGAPVRAEALAGESANPGWARVAAEVTDETDADTGRAVAESSALAVLRALQSPGNTSSVTTNAVPNNVGVTLLTDNGNGVGIEVVTTGTGQSITIQATLDSTGTVRLQPLGGLVSMFSGAGTPQGAAIPNAAGGATIDTEARAAINALLPLLRLLGLIAP